MEKINIYQLLNNGGATLNSNGESVSFSRGYQVSKKDCYTLNVKNVKKIEKAVTDVLKAIDGQKNTFAGVWVDGQKVYIDISERIKSKKKALRVGKARRQISVFEWSTGLCLACLDA